MPDVEYVGVDTYDASDYGMSPRADLVRYDGRRLPFDDASFDHVLCVEVLEHVSEPLPFLIELRRVLKPSGTLVLTVPWSARVHHVPNDYHRFTRFGLKTDLALAGFGDVSVEERGNDIAAIANKLIVVVVQLVRPRRRIVALLTWPVAALLSPLVALSLVAAHMTLVARWGSRDDPLGYGVSAA